MEEDDDAENSNPSGTPPRPASPDGSEEPKTALPTPRVGPFEGSEEPTTTEEPGKTESDQEPVKVDPPFEEPVPPPPAPPQPIVIDNPLYYPINEAPDAYRWNFATGAGIDEFSGASTGTGTVGAESDLTVTGRVLYTRSLSAYLDSALNALENVALPQAVASLLEGIESSGLNECYWSAFPARIGRERMPIQKVKEESSESEANHPLLPYVPSKHQGAETWSLPAKGDFATQMYEIVDKLFHLDVRRFPLDKAAIETSVIRDSKESLTTTYFGLGGRNGNGTDVGAGAQPAIAPVTSSGFLAGILAGGGSPSSKTQSKTTSKT